MAGRKRFSAGLGDRRVILCALLWGTVVAACPAVDHERNAYPVKNAFRDAVREAAQCTVHVLCDGRRTALGAIVDPEGYILTKASELRGEVTCQMPDRAELDAAIVGVDDAWDLALLKVPAKNLPAVRWSDQEAPAVGSWLATPGLDTLPISIGVVSVGPRKIDRRLPALGVVLEDGEQGPRVDRVLEDSGAAKAGIKAGDVVTELDGQPVKDRDAMIATIRDRRPGDKVRLKILRGEESLTLEATLGELSNLVHGDREQFQNSLGGQLSERRAGFPIAIQHDTVLNPNQCGGPVVDVDGKVVGLNIARASRVGSYAIPASSIRPLLDGLKAGKLVTATPAD